MGTRSIMASIGKQFQECIHAYFNTLSPSPEATPIRGRTRFKMEISWPPYYLIDNSFSFLCQSWAPIKINIVYISHLPLHRQPSAAAGTCRDEWQPGRRGECGPPRSWSQRPQRPRRTCHPESGRHISWAPPPTPPRPWTRVERQRGRQPKKRTKVQRHFVGISETHAEMDQFPFLLFSFSHFRWLSSLTLKSSTPSPTASTSPAHSSPRMHGVLGGESMAPRRTIKSWKFRPLQKNCRGKKQTKGYTVKTFRARKLFFDSF